MKIIMFDSGVTQPADKGILLKDILESCESELSEKELAYMMRSESTTEHRPRILRAKSPDEKSNTLTGSMHKGVPHGVISKNFTIMSDKFCNRNASILRDDFDGKAKSFSAMEYVKNGRQGDYIKCGAMRGRQIGNDPTYIQQLEIRADDKTNTLTTAQKDNYVVSENRLIRGDDATDINGHDILKRTYLANGKGPTLNSCGGGNTHAKLQIKPKDDNGCIREYNYRKLTPVECERLQTIPDNFTEGCSNTQRYKMIGNGWTIDVITHILNFLEKNND